MLQAQLPVEARAGRLRLGRRELVALREGEDALFLGGGVERQRFVEVADGAAGGSRVPCVSGAEEPTEQIVQAPVLPRQFVRQGR